MRKFVIVIQCIYLFGLIFGVLGLGIWNFANGRFAEFYAALGVSTILFGMFVLPFILRRLGVLSISQIHAWGELVRSGGISVLFTKK